NTSAASGVFNLTVDTSPPPVPAAPTLLAADDSGTAGDGITNVKQPHLTGTVGGGTTVQIVNAGGSVLGSAAVGPGGSYSVALATVLADGTYPVSVRVVDVAGNTSASSPVLNLTILTTPPAAPTAPALLPADDSGSPGDGTTNV